MTGPSSGFSSKHTCSVQSSFWSQQHSVYFEQGVFARSSHGFDLVSPNGHSVFFMALDVVRAVASVQSELGRLSDLRTHLYFSSDTPHSAMPIECPGAMQHSWHSLGHANACELALPLISSMSVER